MKSGPVLSIRKKSNNLVNLGSKSLLQTRQNSRVTTLTVIRSKDIHSPNLLIYNER